jgi:hypothetical protein
VGDVLSEVVLVNNFLWDGRDLHADVFWAIEWSAKVEVLDVEAGKPGVWHRNDAVEEEFGELERACFDTTVTGVANAIAANGSSFWGRRRKPPVCT